MKRKSCFFAVMAQLFMMPLSVARAQPEPYILAGALAPRTEWAVLVVNNNALDGCTGVALDETHVLTAKHCIADALVKSIKVHYSTDIKNIPDKRGVAVDMQHIYTPEGKENPAVMKDLDLVILKLTVPHKLNKYAPVRYDYTPKRGDDAIIYGYGDHDNVRSLEYHDKPLYQASVKIIGQPSTQIFVKPVNGASTPGDSGGPLIVDGKVVGILWGGDKNPTLESQSIYNAFNHSAFGTLQGWVDTVLKL